MKKILSFLMLMVLSVGSAWADEFTITMKDDPSLTTSDNSKKVTTIEEIIADGASYVSAVEAVNVYNARAGRGVKLGTSSKIGSLTLTLAKSAKPTKIVVKARKYNNSQNAIIVNDKEFTLSDETSEDCVVEYDGNTEVSTIAIAAPDGKYRAYVLSVTVVEGEGGASGGGSGEGGEVQTTDVTVDFTSAEEITAMGFAIPEKNKGTNIESPFTYKDITFTPYAGTTPVRIFCANNDNKEYSLRLYKESKDGNKGAIALTAPEGYGITAVAITGNSNLKNVTSDVGTSDVSKSSNLAWSAGEEAITTVKFENNGTSTVNINTMTISLVSTSPFKMIDNTFDFNNAKNAAVSNDGNHAGDILAEHVITDEVDAEGNPGSGAKLTITPTVTEGAIPSRFYRTKTGPQLRLSGDGGEVKLALHSDDPFDQILINHTNWSKSVTVDNGTFYNESGIWKSDAMVNDVVFTLPAATEDDLAQWWINSIDMSPVFDVVLDVPANADLGAYINTELAKYKHPESLEINLKGGADYTTGESIIVDGKLPFVINGHNATVDASSLSAPFIKMSETPSMEANDKGAYPYDGITLDGIAITNLSQSLFDAKAAKYLIKNIIINNSIIGLSGSKHILDFQSAGSAENVTISNSTLWASSAKKHTGRLFQQQSGTKNPDLGGEGFKLSITNSTLSNICNNSNYVNYFRNNNQTWLTFEVKSSIIADCAKSGTFVKALNQNSDNANPTWIIDNNVFNYGGSDVSASEATNASKAGITNSIAKVVIFTDADNGDFSQPTVSIGDPRWIMLEGGSGDKEATGIEAVKDTQADGAWYTIQGVRVAQPTKGLYIHNGRKVVIK